jgi:hypothetical protein
MLTYLKIGVLVAVLAAGAGGAWYIQGVRIDKRDQKIALQERQLKGYKKALKIMKDDLKTDQESEDEKVRIDALGPDDIVGEFERLRKRAQPRNAEDSDSSETDD